MNLDARVWWRIGCLSFGGPAGQIALMQRMLVDELGWIDQRRFLAALNFCMLLPGPEAQQLATYIGWQRAGWRGAMVSGGLFVLPGMLVMLALSASYVLFGRLAWVEAALAGVKCAVVVIVLEALLRLARRALTFSGAWLIAAAAFLGLHHLNAPFPLIVAAAGGLGCVVGWRQGEPSAPAGASPKGRRGLVFGTLAAWLLPLTALIGYFGPTHMLSAIAALYSELALVTFGGAYAVLAHVAERAVVDAGWLSAGQMADGLGLAETTPGPLILVLQFVAFIAAFQSGQSEAPLLLGVMASLVAIWSLFLPSFVWIFLGGPHIERLNANRVLRTGLSFITAAVVGVIAHLSLWFAFHVMFAKVSWLHSGLLRWLWPEPSSLNLGYLGLTAIAALMMFGLKQTMGRTLVCSALLGVVLLGSF